MATTNQAWPPSPFYVFIFLVAMTAIWNFLVAAYERGVSLGELLGIITPLAVAVFLWGCRHHQKSRPFKLQFSDDPVFMDTREQRIYRSIYEGGLGKQTIHLEINTTEAVNLDRFDVRIMPRRFRWFGPPIPTQIDAVKLVSIDTPALKKSFRRTNPTWEGEITQDEYGGLEFNISPAWLWRVRDPLWVDLTVEAKQKWFGVISFRARTDRQAVARRRVRFRE